MKKKQRLVTKLKGCKHSSISYLSKWTTICKIKFSFQTKTLHESYSNTKIFPGETLAFSLIIPQEILSHKHLFEAGRSFIKLNLQYYFIKYSEWFL